MSIISSTGTPIIEQHNGIKVPPKIGKTGGILVVAEQPAYYESRALVPLVGNSGQEFDRWCAAVHIPINIISKTNVVDLYGPNLNAFFNSKKGVFTKAGWEMCERLYAEIAQIKPKVIVALGNVALAALTGRTGIMKWRGSIIESKVQVPVIPSYHPSHVLRDNTHFAFVCMRDLEVARNIWNGTHKKTERKLTTVFSPKIVEEVFQCAIEKAANWEYVGFDIEVGGDNKQDKKISAFSIAFGNEGFCIPLIRPWEDGLEATFTAEFETVIFSYLNELLSNPKARIITQGGEFDYTFVLSEYGIAPKCKIEDTMVAQHLVMPEFRKSLAFITSIWTDQPYYKDDGKDFLAAGSAWQRFWDYSALDSLMCVEAFPKQMSYIKQQENVEAYERQVALIKPIVSMMDTGIRVDIEELTRVKTKLEIELTETVKELHTYTGTDFNFNSPKQVCEYFYERKKVKPYNNKKGVPSSDSKALKKLARPLATRPAFAEASLILAARKKQKLLSNYLNLDKIDADGRLRCSYNPVGTRFSRLSSSENIRGTGMNMQNWPHKMLSFLKADPGHVIISYDLSQAENRIVGYVAGALEMVQCFDNNIDVHTKTARFIMSVFYGPDLASTMDVEMKAPIGTGEHSWRDWGKRANHGLNYDLGYLSFSEIYELTPADSKKIVSGYNMLYPEVDRRFRAHVRQCIRTSGMITNLFNRKIRFYGKPIDTVFKDAYACIPQGSVGDHISEWGMLPLFYDSDFEGCQLLMQVHDRLTWQVPLSLGWNKIAKQIKLAKELAEQELCAFMTTNLTFRIPADFYVGLTCNTDCEITGTKYKSRELNLPIEELATMLENHYLELFRQC